METARVAGAADIECVTALGRSMRSELSEMRGGALWATREARPEPLEAAYLALCTRDDARLTVGTIDGVVVGYGTAELEPLRDGRVLGVIAELFVEPGARGVGVGEAIASDLVEFCTAAGCCGIDATALPGNRDAKNFFERSGFVARALVMHRTLEGS